MTNVIKIAKQSIFLAIANFRLELLAVTLLSWICANLLLLSFRLGIVIFIAIASLLCVMMLSLHLRSKTAFLWMIIIFPLLPFHMGYDFFAGLIPVFRVHRVIIAIMLLFWIFKSKTIVPSIKEFPLTKILAILFLLMFFSSIFSSFPIFSLLYLGTFILEYFLFAVMFFDLSKDEEIRNKIFLMVAISAFLIAIVGIFEYYTGFNIYSVIKPFRQGMEYSITQQLREGNPRIRASFDHSISFGIYPSLSLAAIAYLYPTACRSLIKKCSLIAVFFTICFSIYLTRSRIALLFLLTFLFTMLILKNRKIFLILVIIALIFLVQPFFMQKFKTDLIERFMTTALPFQYGSGEMIRSSFARLDQIKSMSGFIAEKPLLGHGRIGAEIRSVDNFYLLFTFNFGLLGLASYLIFVLGSLFIAISVYIKETYIQWRLFGIVMIGVLGGLMLVWAAVSLESYFYLLWIYIGILFRIYRQGKAKDRSFSKSISKGF